MIAVKFEEKEKIGLQYALETLHGCSPFGQERIRRLFLIRENRALWSTVHFVLLQASVGAASTVTL